MNQQVHLVTGGAGFVGSNIVARLVQEGNQVRVLDNLSTGHRRNLENFLSDKEGGSSDRVEFIEGDIRDRKVVKKCLKDVKYVFHQAALPSVPRSIEDPAESVSVAVDGTLTILEESRKEGVKRVVYAASSSAYGANETVPKKESFRPEPLSPYAAGKLAAEYLCKVFSDCYGLETVSLRYFNVFGPGQDLDSPYAAVIPKFIDAFLEKRSPVVFGDGNQTRDFTFVDNVVEANLLAASAPSVGDGRVMNVACGQSISLLDLLDSLSGILGPCKEPRFKDPRPGDVMHSLADITEAKSHMGYDVVVPLYKGLEKTVQWYRKFKKTQEY